MPLAEPTKARQPKQCYPGSNTAAYQAIPVVGTGNHRGRSQASVDYRGRAFGQQWRARAIRFATDQCAGFARLAPGISPAVIR